MALSTPKSEDTALADVGRELVPNKELLGFLELVGQERGLVSVFVYLAVKFGGKSVRTGRTKRIDVVRCPFVREKVEKVTLIAHVLSMNQRVRMVVRIFFSHERLACNPGELRSIMRALRALRALGDHLCLKLCWTICGACVNQNGCSDTAYEAEALCWKPLIDTLAVSFSSTVQVAAGILHAICCDGRLLEITVVFEVGSNSGNRIEPQKFGGVPTM